MHLLPSNCLPLSRPLLLLLRRRVRLLLLSLPRVSWSCLVVAAVALGLPSLPEAAGEAARRCRAECAAEERRGDCGLPFRRCRFAPRRRPPSVPRLGLVSFSRSRASWPRGSHSQLRKLCGLSECCVHSPYPCCAEPVPVAVSGARPVGPSLPCCCTTRTGQLQYS